VGITPRSDDYAQWYHDVIAASEMVDSSPVRGCMVLRPHGFAVWDAIKNNLDQSIRDTGHVNAYFPLLIPQVCIITPLVVVVWPVWFADTGCL